MLTDSLFLLVWIAYNLLLRPKSSPIEFAIAKFAVVVKEFANRRRVLVNYCPRCDRCTGSTNSIPLHVSSIRVHPDPLREPIECKGPDISLKSSFVSSSVIKFPYDVFVSPLSFEYRNIRCTGSCK